MSSFEFVVGMAMMRVLILALLWLTFLWRWPRRWLRRHELRGSVMATEVQRPAEANLQPPTAEVPTKPSENWEAPLPDGKNYVTGSHEGEIPVGDEHFELESNGSDAGSTPRSRFEKAEVISAARKERVEVEANAYLESEIRKVNARAHIAQVSPTTHLFHITLPTLCKFPPIRCCRILY